MPQAQGFLLVPPRFSTPVPQCVALCLRRHLACQLWLFDGLYVFSLEMFDGPQMFSIFRLFSRTVTVQPSTFLGGAARTLNWGLRRVLECACRFIDGSVEALGSFVTEPPTISHAASSAQRYEMRAPIPRMCAPIHAQQTSLLTVLYLETR
jgi:hypothetical protein